MRSAKPICSYKSKIEIYCQNSIAYIIVPLFDGNDDSITLELKPGRKKENK
jgi:hypothetical protein